MTELLTQAYERICSLPEATQDAIAVAMLDLFEKQNEPDFLSPEHLAEFSAAVERALNA
jgi:hypothetical protein